MRCGAETTWIATVGILCHGSADLDWIWAGLAFNCTLHICRKSSMPRGLHATSRRRMCTSLHPACKDAHKIVSCVTMTREVGPRDRRLIVTLMINSTPAVVGWVVTSSLVTPVLDDTLPLRRRVYCGTECIRRTNGSKFINIGFLAMEETGGHCVHVSDTGW